MPGGVSEEVLKGLLSAEVANVALFIMGIGIILVIVLVINIRQLGKWYLPIMTKRNEEFSLIRQAIEHSVATDKQVLDAINGLRDDFANLRVIILEKKEVNYSREELSEIVRAALGSAPGIYTEVENRRPNAPLFSRIVGAILGFPPNAYQGMNR